MGVGAVTPVGVDVPSIWRALEEGRSGIGPIRRFDASRYPVTFAAEVAVAGEGPHRVPAALL